MQWLIFRQRLRKIWPPFIPIFGHNDCLTVWLKWWSRARDGWSHRLYLDCEEVASNPAIEKDVHPTCWRNFIKHPDWMFLVYMTIFNQADWIISASDDVFHSKQKCIYKKYVDCGQARRLLWKHHQIDGAPTRLLSFAEVLHDPFQKLEFCHAAWPPSSRTRCAEKTKIF